MDRRAWQVTAHGVTKNLTGLSSEHFPFTWASLVDQTNFTFTFHFHELEKEMATHSSVLARDGGAWWAAVSGVAQSWTRLK